MKTTVIRIGNSRGIIIPSAILKRLGMMEGSVFQMEAKDDVLTLSPFTEDEELKKTRAFLEACGGSWEGTETTEEIMQSIKAGNVEKEIIRL